MNLTERLSVSAYDWGHIPLYQWLDVLERFGVHQMELWTNNLPPDPVEQVRDTLASRGVQVICVNATVAFLPNRTDDVARVQAGILDAIRQAEMLGARYVNTYLGPNPRRDLTTTVRLYTRNIQPCLEAAAGRGIILVLENHFDIRNEDPGGGDVARRPETLRYLVEEVGSPHFKLTCDPANFYMAGIEPYPFAYELLRPYIGYVHLKDAVRYHELLHGPVDGIKVLSDSIAGPFVPVAVGRGAVNYEGLLARLVQDGYDGYLTVEPHTKKEHLERVCLETLQYVRAHVRAAAA
ncbi:MAG: sugar phosphate isomerase/epimerase [Ardenticatenaceae bacterium]|nr:sugar phosphate isomerase/epimerase [Ardenticatenaceae bacterium]